MARKPVLIDMNGTDDGELVERVEDQDAENAWDGWISDLRNSQASGMIRVARLPTDKDGTALPNAKGQVQLGSWPHDQYDYDGLLSHIRQRFMKPGEIMHIRIQGFEAGKAGVKVNQIVSLQRDAMQSANESATSQLGEVLTAMREDRAALTTTLQTILTPRESAPLVPSSFMPAFKEMTVVALPIIGTIISALISRPAKPPADLAGLIEIAKMLSGKGDDGEEREEDNSLAGIIKAVAPNGLKLLDTIAQNLSRSPPTVQLHPRPVAPQQLNAPVATVAPAKPMQPTAPAAPTLIESPVTVETTPMFAVLKPQLEELCNLAARGVDAGEVAKLTVQLLPPEFDESFGELVADKTSFERLRLLVPRMAEFPDWFEVLRTALEKEIFDDDATTVV